MARKLWWRLCAGEICVEQIKTEKQNIKYGGSYYDV